MHWEIAQQYIWYFFKYCTHRMQVLCILCMVYKFPEWAAFLFFPCTTSLVHVHLFLCVKTNGIYTECSLLSYWAFLEPRPKFFDSSVAQCFTSTMMLHPQSLYMKWMDTRCLFMQCNSVHTPDMGEGESFHAWMRAWEDACASCSLFLCLWFVMTYDFHGQI